MLTLSRQRPSRHLWGLKWRSSISFITFDYGVGITTDLIIYSMMIPFLPFHLERLSYSRVSVLVGFLLFGLEAGVVLATPITAWLSEKYKARQSILLTGLLASIFSQGVMLVSRQYWLMVIAQVFQGMSSAMVWVAGLALICDTVPQEHVGQQLGLATSGLTLGQMIGPPSGGWLYDRFGFRAPWIFTITITSLDLLGRLCMVEGQKARIWAADPANVSGCSMCIEDDLIGPATVSSANPTNSGTSTSCKHGPLINSEISIIQDDTVSTDEATPPSAMTPSLSLIEVTLTLLKSSRALTAIVNIAIYGFVTSSLEPTLPLHLQKLWGLGSSDVGIVLVLIFIPTLIALPISGRYSDSVGTEWVTILCLLGALPWWAAINVNASLTFFIVSYALKRMFNSSVVSPLTAELASVCRTLDGVGYAHVYGAFNLAYAIGCGLGNLVGGEMYERIEKGWLAGNILNMGLVTVSIAIALKYTGNHPLMGRVFERLRQPGIQLREDDDA
ncbi:MFS general substrate transporter [Stereum hirsutum FP-91666 SS1]|uniref:MFS general substrate transporter n=1 Tax=Stereum hirsutum (strain FP-91666) TaxID=721885 RepID=UPI000440D546|nr:MFS general substrate transporter [Stereum hirsutum FP-91666 SS1]EIM91045.1 MFS general substrate transporter [Stereum hirsutum FP-91666 SS1]